MWKLLCADHFLKEPGVLGSALLQRPFQDIVKVLRVFKLQNISVNLLVLLLLHKIRKYVLPPIYGSLGELFQIVNFELAYLVHLNRISRYGVNVIAALIGPITIINILL